MVWAGPWSMDTAGGLVESGDTGLQTTVQIHVLIYVTYQDRSLFCNSLYILDRDGDFRMGANSCYPTRELLIP